MIGKLLLAGILATTLVLAQGRGGGGGGMGGGGSEGGMGGMGGGMGAGGSRPDRLEQMTNLLKLNKDQKKEVKSIMDDGQKQATPVREQMAKGRLAIGDALQAGKTGDDLKSVIDSEAAIESQMAGIEINAFAKIFKALDKDQQANTRTLFQMMKGVFTNKNWNGTE